MLRSNRSFRSLCALFAAVLVCAVALPASALAQNIDPTDVEYGNGDLDVAAAGNSGDPSDPTSDTGAAEATGISELPFTGLDVAAIAAIGAGLLGAGLVVRRASRADDTA